MTKTLCAVGDSFIFGAELIETHCKDEFKHLSKAEMTTLEFDLPENEQDFYKYFNLLDSMRFTSLMARELGYNYINFAQAGASQEGIKLQSYLLLESLRKKGVDPKDTVWVIGITVPSRVMQLLEGNDTWYDMLLKRHDDLEFLMSRFTSRSVFPGNLENSHNDFSKAFAKEFVTHFNSTNFLLSWAMHLVDIANLLRANSVEKFIFVNLIPTLPHILRHLPVSYTVLTTVTTLLRQHGVLANAEPEDFEDLGEKLKITKNRCGGGHYDKYGNAVIARYLIDTHLK